MLCFKDQSYCGSENCTNRCGRKITEEELKHAEDLGLPIAYIKYCN